MAGRTVGMCTLFLLLAIGVFHPTAAQQLNHSSSGYDLADDDQVWVEETLASMNLRQQIAQLIIQWLPGSYASTNSDEFMEWADWIQNDQIGGIYLSIGLPHSYAAKINELQGLSTVPLLVTSDFENGGPGMRINHSYALPSLLPQGGGTSFPPTMAFGAIGDADIVQEFARITAVEAKALGVSLNFAPVLDVNNNPNNPVINTRSFGEDPVEVARLGAAYIEGAHQGGLLVTAKHFPGHGDTDTDSHIGLPVINAGLDRLRNLELIPFEEAVDAGVDAVMTAHITLSEQNGSGSLPATLDPRFMEGLLREEMGFNGLLFTDALTMGALAAQYGTGELAVLAIEAGNDVLLMPSDIGETIDAIHSAVETGRIASGRIESSVRRILGTKARIGLHQSRTVDLNAVDEIVGRQEHLDFAALTAERSLTLLRDEDHVIPIELGETLNVFSLTYAREEHLVAGRELDARLRSRVRRVTSGRIGPNTSSEEYDALLVAASNSDLVLVNIFLPPVSGLGEIGVSEKLKSFITSRNGIAPMMVTSFGNPYLLQELSDSPGYLLAWGDHEVSQRAVVRGLFGDIGLSGKLPISIPPFYSVGDGLNRPSGASLQQDAEVLGTHPETVGMSEDGLEALDQRIMQGIADGATPGVALAVARKGYLVRLKGYGTLDWDESSAKVGVNSIYDLASLTKVVGTTTAAMVLIDEGRLSLDDPVLKHLPWWAEQGSSKAKVTIGQLLLHRAGLPPFRRFYHDMEGEAAYKDAISALELDYEPGSATVYSDIGLMTLAFVVEEISGRPFENFLKQNIWNKLGMNDTSFNPAGDLIGRIAPTEIDTVFRHVHVHGEVHDENAYALGGVAGHAGLFSTISDLSLFGQMLLNGGLLEGCLSVDGSDGEICVPGMEESVRIVSERSADLFTKRFDDTAYRAIGWDTPSGRSSAGDYFTSEAFGHTGYTGTSIWLDPELDLFVVLLTNRVNPTRDNQKHVALRRSVHDLAALAIQDGTVVKRSN
jgi:beta-N-acetylhexosaminidase